MAIKFTWAKLPVDESGKAYDSLAAFQAAEIAKLIPQAELTPKMIVEHKAEIIEILELTESARPSARGKRKGKTIQSLGGKARDAALTDERKSEIAKQAANARWGNKDADTQPVAQGELPKVA